MQHWRFSKSAVAGLAVPGSQTVPRPSVVMCRSFTAALLAMLTVALDAPPPASARPFPGAARVIANAAYPDPLPNSPLPGTKAAADALQSDAGPAAQPDGLRYLVPVAEPSDSSETDLDSAQYIMPGCRQFLVSKTQLHFLEGNCNGIVETIEFMSPDLCVPPGSTLDEAVRIVVQYIDARPVRQQEDFRLLALEALVSAWSCRR